MKETSSENKWSYSNDFSGMDVNWIILETTLWQNSNSVMLGNGRSQNFGQWFDKTSDSALTESHIRMSSKTCFIISSLCQQDHLLLNLSKM